MGKITHASRGNKLTPAEYEASNAHLINEVANTNIVRTATYVVAASDALAHVKAQADYVCDGTADDVQIQAAIDAISTWAWDTGGGGDVVLSEGGFSIDTTLSLPIGKRLILSEGTRIYPTTNANMLEMALGSTLRGGYFYAKGLANYSGVAIKVLAGGTDGAYRRNTIIGDVVVNNESTILGTGIELAASGGDPDVISVKLSNVSIKGFYSGLKLSAADSGSACNANFADNITLSYQVYPLHLVNTTGNNVGGNQLTNIHIQPSADTVYGIYIEGACNSNIFDVSVSDWNVSNGASPTFVIVGTGCQYNRFTVSIPPQYGLYKLSYANNHVENVETFNARENSLQRSWMPLGAVVYAPMSTMAANTLVNLALNGAYNVGANHLISLNTPTAAGKNGLYGLTFNTTTQYAYADEYIAMDSGVDAVVLVVVEPSFEYDDNTLHTFAHWGIVSESKYMMLCKNASNDLQFYTKNGASVVDISGSVVFSAGDLLVLVAIRDVTNTTTSLYCNGVLVATSASVCTSNTSARRFYINSSDTPDNYGGGTYYTFGFLTKVMPVPEIINLTTPYVETLGSKMHNSGTAAVLNSNTSIVVSHGLITTPTRVQITPRENPTNAVAFWWVDTLTTTQFTINVNADPGASNLDFDWHAQIGEG